jgi:hypothetical protein
MKKWTNELNRLVSKEDIQKDKTHMKKFSLSLAIKEMKIKTTLRLHLISVRMATIKNTMTTNVGEDVGEKEPLLSAVWSVN